MKKLYLILLSVFALLNAAVAQKLSVESFVLAPTDITAQTEGRKDLNGDACALVKIFVVGDVADVEGNVVKPLVKKNSPKRSTSYGDICRLWNRKARE